MRKIVAAGSILVDRINEIGAYPKAGELVQIRSVSSVPGGLVPNTGCDVKILDPSIPVAAIGAVGDDDLGCLAVTELERRGLDVSGVVVKKGVKTSFTDVMSVAGGERTFFTYPGASAEWGFDDFPFDLVGQGDIVLLGYFLLLARIDGGDGLRILRELKRRGAETAIDLVTESSDRYGIVHEVLPYVDHLIVNEIEAERIAFGAEAGRAPSEIARRLMDCGVGERVVIHMPERGVSLRRDGSWTERPSFRLPDGFVKGKTGAGDAFCAGALVGIYRGFSEAELLDCGSTAAVGALSAPGATEGMRTLDELRAVVAGFGTAASA